MRFNAKLPGRKIVISITINVLFTFIQHYMLPDVSLFGADYLGRLDDSEYRIPAETLPVS